MVAARASRFDLRVAVGLCTVLLIVAAWGGLAALLALERGRALQNVAHENGNLARVFEEHVLRTIKNGDQTARVLKSQYERYGARFDIARYARDIAIDASLFNILSVIDENGDLVLASQPFAAQNLRDREHFKFHARNAGQGLHISKPLRGRTTGKWSIFLTRRIDKPDGSFGGVAVVALDPDYFSNFYGQIDLGKNGVVSLVGRDGIVRARQSERASEPGQDISASPLFARLAKETQGSYAVTSIIDGIPRILNYRALRDYPLIVMVGAAEDSALARYYQRRGAYLWLVSLFSLGFLLIALLLIRQLSRQRALRLAADKSEASLRELADSMPQLVWTVRPDGTYEYSNQRWFEYTGMIPATAQISEWRQLVHPDDFESYTECWARAIQAGQPFQIEYRLKRLQDGVYHWHLGRAVPVRDAQGEVVRWLGTSTEIEGQKRAEALLDQLNDELEARVQERTRELESFSYSVSHDLRAPLRAISGFAQILARRHRESLSADGRHFLDNIVEASAHMGRLIDDLLSYSRLGRKAVVLKPTKLADVLAAVARNVTPRVSEYGATLHIVDDLPAVQGDWTLLSQIFTNLVDNALTYRKPGVPVTVSVTWKGVNDDVVVSVSDNGIGIEAEYFEKIFNVFQRLHSQDEYPGTGIGLAVVKKAADLQNGRVWVDSAVGAGTVFHVQLAKAQPAAVNVTPSLPAPMSAAALA